MLNVVDDRLVVEEKGIYSVEKFLLARRFMYWQVYLHKTGLVAEQLLTRVLKRAKVLTNQGVILKASDALSFFLQNEITPTNFDDNTLETFSRLDDTDIMSAMKDWQYHDDFILKHLCSMIINRDLLKIKLKNKPIKRLTLDKHISKLVSKYNISETDAEYFVFTEKISNLAYESKRQKIKILQNSGKVVDIIKASDQFNIKALSKSVTKYYICYPKE
jgi:HD superfamily phosphohydrolase